MSELVPGVTTSQQIDFAPLTPDKISNSYNNADYYTFCAAAREYSITATSHPTIGWGTWGFSGSILTFALSSSHATQNTQSETLTVDLKIGGAVLHSVTARVEFDVSCKGNTVIASTSDFSNLSLTTQSSSYSDTWLFKTPTNCKDKYTVAIDETADVDDLVQLTE